MKEKVTILLSALLLCSCAIPPQNDTSVSEPTIPPMRYVPTSYTTEGGSYLVPCPDCGGCGSVLRIEKRTSYQPTGLDTTFLIRQRGNTTTKKEVVSCYRCAGTGYVQPH